MILASLSSKHLIHGPGVDFQNKIYLIMSNLDALILKVFGHFHFQEGIHLGDIER